MPGLRNGRRGCGSGKNGGRSDKDVAPRRDDSIFTEERPEEKSDICDFYRNVMAVLEGREESLIRLEEVARVMRVMEAIFESSGKKQVVQFEV